MDYYAKKRRGREEAIRKKRIAKREERLERTKLFLSAMEDARRNSL